MAQPLFEDHPLQQYFQESGDISEPMPGGTEFTTEQGGGCVVEKGIIVESVKSLLGRVQIPGFVYDGLNVASSYLAPLSHTHSDNTFAERFKYDVISSSLLSTAIAGTPHAGRRSFASELPPEDEAKTEGHSRSSSSTDAVNVVFLALPSLKSLASHPAFGSIQVTVLLVSIAVAAFAADYEFASYILVALAFYNATAVKPDPDKPDAATLTLDAVNELISAGNVWDSSVNEAMGIIEKDEQSPSVFYGPTSPLSPVSSLRIALQATLNTTQSQCDNVRHLLSALTSPTQLAQLSEMYAPTSPVKPSFEHPRPLSDPLAAWRKHNSSLSPALINKRATWNGSNPLTFGGSPSPLAKKRVKRQSELPPLFRLPDPQSYSLSAPPTPLRLKMLQDVQEEDNDSDSELPYMKTEDSFGAAALNLQRKRRSVGMEVFGATPPPPSYASHVLGQRSHHMRSGSGSPSRFTLLQTNRHPLSLSALHMALHGALASKRYACAHLLALRFEEDADDDAYWEDVRSVIALLTSTFTDTSARLLVALDEAEKRRIKDQRPSTESVVGSSREGSLSPDGASKRPIIISKPGMMPEITSFAPMPSHLSRFAAHVEAISSALNEAKEHLEHCVAALRDPSSTVEADDLNASTTVAADGSTQDVFMDVTGQNAALQAYDRLRKELGYALRECERGRERLLDVIAPKHPAPQMDEEDLDAEVCPPPLAHDTSSEDSAGVETDIGLPVRDLVAELRVAEVDRGEGLDDATQHLLLSTTPQHLPSPGIEQVFEAESGVEATWKRERSKLTREERIKLAKARRESAGSAVGSGSASSSSRRSSMEQWGPGSEVVQELKDVIWKVGEKKRKMSERSNTIATQAQEPTPTVLNAIDSQTIASESSIIVAATAEEGTS